MSVKAAQKSLKIFSYIEIVGGLLFVILTIMTITGQPDLIEAINKIKIDDLKIDIKTLAIITYAIVAAFAFFEAYLMQRACKDGKKTTLLLVLAILSTLAEIMSIVQSFSVISVISLIISAFILYSVIVVRKNAN